MQPMIHMAGGFEDIIPVVVIFGVLISKVVRASRKAKKGGVDLEPESSAKRPPRSDELRKFLETITGTAVAPEPAQLRPMPREIPVAAVAPAPPPPPVVVLQPEASPILSKSHIHGAPMQREYDWDHRPSNETVLLVEPLAIGKDLVDRKGLAKAIVLSEILGPPLGLQ